MEEPWKSMTIFGFVAFVLLVFLLVLNNEGVIFIRSMIGG